MSVFFTILRIFCDILTFAVFLRAIMSWISTGQNNIFTDILYHITEPILSPLRRILPKVEYFDLSPMAAIIILQAISYFIP
jgi:YggT family protein